MGTNYLITYLTTLNFFIQEDIEEYSKFEKPYGIDGLHELSSKVISLKEEYKEKKIEEEKMSRIEKLCNKFLFMAKEMSKVDISKKDYQYYTDMMGYYQIRFDNLVTILKEDSTC